MISNYRRGLHFFLCPQLSQLVFSLPTLAKCSAELSDLVKRSPHMIEEEAAKFAALLCSDPDVGRKSRAILSIYRKHLAKAGAPPEKSMLEHSQEPLEARPSFFPVG